MRTAELRRRLAQAFLGARPGIARHGLTCPTVLRANAMIRIAASTLPAFALQLAMVMSAHAQSIAPFVVAGDAITEPLGGYRGEAARGKTIAFDPERGNCTICHPVPGGDVRIQGDVAPTLAGVAGRLSEGQIRLRLVDGTRINPRTIMPAYHRVDGLNRVGPSWRGRPVLSADQIEDIVAFLLTLKE